MPRDSTKSSTNSNQKESKTKSETKVERKSNFANVKNIVLKHLSKYKSELKDEVIEFKPIELGTKNSIPIAALKLKKKKQEGKDSPELHKQREQVVEMVEQLVNGIKHEGEKVVVVNVNTPAVDLDKSFSQDQLSYMKNDIFSSIEEQLGVKFQPEVGDQWEEAFAAMISIVDAHKRKSS